MNQHATNEKLEVFYKEVVCKMHQIQIYYHMELLFALFKNYLGHCEMHKNREMRSLIRICSNGSTYQVPAE